MIDIMGAFASEVMNSGDAEFGYPDLEFEDAVGAVLDRWGAFKIAPDDKATQHELCRALRHAKLLYKGICRQYGKTYMGGAEKLRAVVDEIGGLFGDARNSEVSHSIRRQLKEILEA